MKIVSLRQKAELAVPAALISVKNVIVFLYQRCRASSEVLDELERAKSCLELLQAYLTDSKDQIDSLMVGSFVEVAHGIEDALDEFMLQFSQLLLSEEKSRSRLGNQISQPIYDLADPIPESSEALAVNRLSSKINKKIELVKKLDLYTPDDGSISRPDDNLTEKIPEEMVGFEEPKERLLKQLMKKDSGLLTISIVGPGGSGKTTLVKNLYSSKRVQGFFDCSEWIDVPSPLNLDVVPMFKTFEAGLHELDDSRSKLRLLLQILSMFNPFEDSRSKLRLLQQIVFEAGLPEEEDSRSKLRMLLQKKRFLIVIDDVWSKSDLKGILRYLPEGLPGSKIVIITCNSDVASFSVESSEFIHDLSTGLSFQQSYDLLCKKAFQNGICPTELRKCAEEILLKCSNSPFAISAVGTILATEPQTEVHWRHFHDGLGSEIKGDSNLSILGRIIQPSYRHFPSHLKSCFLYLGIFPEGFPIPRPRLLRLWVAEGFVEPTAGLTEEEVAEQYLNELIASNLVHVVSRGIDGRVKSCGVSPIVRGLIISKKFVTDFKTIQDGSTLSEPIRRLCVHHSGIEFVTELNCLRTLQVSRLSESRLSDRYGIEMVFQANKFLKVLDLHGTALVEFPKHIDGLTLLKYLSLRETKIKNVPGSIKKLLYLETLDVRHTFVAYLPEEICELERLRHLFVFCKNGSGGVDLSRGNLGALSASIQKLSLVKVGLKMRNNIIKALGELTGLRKLGVTDLEKVDGKELCCSVQKMENLSSFDVRSTNESEYLELDHMQPPPYLQHLYLEGRLATLPQWIPQLTSVTKIGLKWSKLNVSVKPLEALQALPNLVVLNLIDFYSGEELVFRAQTFQKLMELSIDQFGKLKVMIVEDGAMCQLKKLTLSRCQNLKSLPLGIEGVILREELDLHHDGMPSEFIAHFQQRKKELDPSTSKAEIGFRIALVFIIGKIYRQGLLGF